MSDLSHIDSQGRAVMVDVSSKDDTMREAVARCEVVMQPTTLSRVTAGQVSKGDVIATARLAGIMAAKRTGELIPLCHPLLLYHIDVELTPDSRGDRLLIEAVVKTAGKTGVEMEALTAVTVAGLTVYDMCKAVDRGIMIERVRLVHKRGGKSGVYLAEGDINNG